MITLTSQRHCGITNVSKWVRNRRDYVEGIDNGILAKTMNFTGKPDSREPGGRKYEMDSWVPTLD